MRRSRSALAHKSPFRHAAKASRDFLPIYRRIVPATTHNKTAALVREMLQRDAGGTDAAGLVVTVISRARVREVEVDVIPPSRPQR
jgi:hypothetical protein